MKRHLNKSSFASQCDKQLRVKIINYNIIIFKDLTKLHSGDAVSATPSPLKIPSSPN